ncbi:MAG: phage portal protein [Arcobacter sp.]|nr:phage portal protein [Arcobacter sp.]
MIIFMEKERFYNLDLKEIEKIIKNNSDISRYELLKDYYIGKHNILRCTKKNANVPNNKLVNNIAKYITDTATGYFIGMPVVYSSLNDEFMANIQNIYDYNDEQDHNMELAKDMSIYGVSYEMIYLDELANIRFVRISPKNLIMIKTPDTKEVLGVIRVINTVDKDNKAYKKIEVWSDIDTTYMTYKDDKLIMGDRINHYFNDVPFVEYINNEERLGDFEGVISLIDAYNKVASNTANMFEYNDEAILKITKMGDVSSKEIAQMKEDLAIILEDGGDIDWLLKSLDDRALENYKKRLRDDIHIFANVPNMTDDSFGGNLSGVAVSYKLWGLEQTTAIKERKFKKGLQRRIELVTNILNIKGASYNYMDIETSFRRNKPQNLLEIAQIIQTLAGELSKETKLSMLPNVVDVQLELQKIEEEKLKDEQDFGANTTFMSEVKVDEN